MCCYDETATNLEILSSFDLSTTSSRMQSDNESVSEREREGECEGENQRMSMRSLGLEFL